MPHGRYQRLFWNRFLAIQLSEYEPITQHSSTLVVLSVTLLDWALYRKRLWQGGFKRRGYDKPVFMMGHIPDK
jgi:hypothetical protein